MKRVHDNQGQLKRKRIEISNKKNTQKQIKVLKESENERKNSIICSCAFWPPPNFTPPSPPLHTFINTRTVKNKLFQLILSIASVQRMSKFKAQGIESMKHQT